ncbi:MAG: GNAT family N-acetyltransferase [Acidimicrobiales bacterium]
MAALSPAAIVDAAESNHRSWSAARAGLSGGYTLERAGGLVSYLFETAGGGDEIEVMFAEPTDDELAGLVDEVEQLIEPRERRPRLVRDVGWWSATDDRSATLGPRLLARGFQWGWAPLWMGLDLSPGSSGRREPRRLAERFPPPDGVAFEEATDGVDWNVPDLPYHDRHGGRLARRLADLRPPTVTLAAFDRTLGPAPGRVVGQVVVHLASDDPGNAGIYNCGVVPERRGRGIGAALTAAAADRAADLGGRLVTLNATTMGEPVYRRVGFTSGGRGRTWWLTPRQLMAPRPSSAMVDLVEAIGFGDLGALDLSLSTLAADRPLDLDAPLRCGLTPIGIAVQFGRADAAQRLVDHGAVLDVVSAWDLGWRERVPALLRDDPTLADRPTGELGATPLQIAIERDDEDLARVVLAAGPDLTIRDRRFGSDALGWADHFGRPRFAELIRSRSA